MWPSVHAAEVSSGSWNTTGAGISPSSWPQTLVRPGLSPWLSYFLLLLTPWVISLRSWLRMPHTLHESKPVQPPASRNSWLLYPTASSTHQRWPAATCLPQESWLPHPPSLPRLSRWGEVQCRPSICSDNRAWMSPEAVHQTLSHHQWNIFSIGLYHDHKCCL